MNPDENGTWHVDERSRAIRVKIRSIEIFIHTYLWLFFFPQTLASPKSSRLAQHSNSNELPDFLSFYLGSVRRTVCSTNWPFPSGALTLHTSEKFSGWPTATINLPYFVLQHTYTRAPWLFVFLFSFTCCIIRALAVRYNELANSVRVSAYVIRVAVQRWRSIN